MQVVRLDAEGVAELLGGGDQLLVEGRWFVVRMQRVEGGAQLAALPLAVLHQPQRHRAVTQQLPAAIAQ